MPELNLIQQGLVSQRDIELDRNACTICALVDASAPGLCVQGYSPGCPVVVSLVSC